LQTDSWISAFTTSAGASRVGLGHLETQNLAVGAGALQRERE
jgi:hypothetical protein